MAETFFASHEGRLLGLGLALIGLMLLAFGVGWLGYVLFVLGAIFIAIDAWGLLGNENDAASFFVEFFDKRTHSHDFSRFEKFAAWPMCRLPRLG